MQNDILCSRAYAQIVAGSSIDLVLKLLSIGASTKPYATSDLRHTLTLRLAIGCTCFAMHLLQDLERSGYSGDFFRMLDWSHLG